MTDLRDLIKLSIYLKLHHAIHRIFLEICKSVICFIPSSPHWNPLCIILQTLLGRKKMRRECQMNNLIYCSHTFRKQGFGRLCAQISLHEFKKWSWFNRIILYRDKIKYLQQMYVYIVCYKYFICHSSKAYLGPFQTSVADLFFCKKIHHKCLRA